MYFGVIWKINGHWSCGSNLMGCSCRNVTGFRVFSQNILLLIMISWLLMRVVKAYTSSWTCALFFFGWVDGYLVWCLSWWLKYKINFRNHPLPWGVKEEIICSIYFLTIFLGKWEYNCGGFMDMSMRILHWLWELLWLCIGNYCQQHPFLSCKTIYILFEIANN